MNPFLSAAQEMNSRYNDQISKVCRPFFDCFNLKHFWFYKLTDDGHISFGNSYAQWNEFFSANNYWLTYPHICHPKFHKQGVYLHNNVQEASLKPIWKSGSDQFEIGQCIAIVNKIPGGIEEFGFSSSCPSSFQTNTLLNELHLFHLFYEKFKLENRKLLLKADDNQINIAQMMSGAFNRNTLPMNKISQRGELIKKMGLDSGDQLSSREIEVIRLLLLGYSAGKIGNGIRLSRRTVEHHIERIKNKLGCHSKVDLIQKGRELERFGCLKSDSDRPTFFLGQ